MSKDIFDLNERVIVVTGGAGQLGNAFTQALANAGAYVAVIDARAVDPTNRIFPIACDVTDRKALSSALSKIERKWETPSGLVNAAALDSPPNASADENGPFESYPMSSFEDVMNVNVKGVLLCCQVFGGAMAQLGRGAIVNVASIYGMVSPDQSLYQYRRDRGEEFFKPVAYSVSKSALYNLTRYLAVYWGSKNIRVNTVTLAGVFNNQDSEFLAGYCQKVPLGRMADESDYNGIIQFLLSDAACYVTGANIVADGGFTAM